MNSEIMTEMTFDAGHRIVGHKGKCARLHGHTYRARITCQGEVTDPGFVADFGDIKEMINTWDHRFLLWDEDPFWQELGGVIPDVMETYGLVNVPFNPTAEHMAYYLASWLKLELNLDSVTVELWETPNSKARATA